MSYVYQDPSLLTYFFFALCLMAIAQVFYDKKKYEVKKNDN